jgi:hypothetical protein
MSIQAGVRLIISLWNLWIEEPRHVTLRNTMDAVRQQGLLPEEENMAGEGKTHRRHGVSVCTFPTAGKVWM